MLSRRFISVLCVANAVAVCSAQEPKKKIDDRMITVTGCVEKGYLNVRALDAVGSYAERYRLRGSKQMMKEMVETYNKHVLEVTGAVTDLTRETEHRGKTIAVGKKTRITTGAKEIPSVPVAGLDATLEVASFREMNEICAR